MPDDHARRSVRLPRHAYADGVYFITICTADRRHLFGKIKNGRMELSRPGFIVRREWRLTGHLRANTHLDAFVIMPDHVHFIIRIKPPAPGRRRGAPQGALGRQRGRYQSDGLGLLSGVPGVSDERVAYRMEMRAGTLRGAPTDAGGLTMNEGRRFGPKPSNALPMIIDAFKSSVTRSVRRMGYVGDVWQRGYYDRVIRHADELFFTREYIRMNPTKWAETIDENAIFC